MSKSVLPDPSVVSARLLSGESLRALAREYGVATRVIERLAQAAPPFVEVRPTLPPPEKIQEPLVTRRKPPADLPQGVDLGTPIIRDHDDMKPMSFDSRNAAYAHLVGTVEHYLSTLLNPPKVLVESVANAKMALGLVRTVRINDRGTR